MQKSKEKFYCKDPNSKVHRYCSGAFFVALIEGIITIFTPLDNTIGLYIFLIILLFSFILLVLTLDAKAVGITFYNECFEYNEMSGVGTISYNDICAICIMHERIRAKFIMDNYSINLDFQDRRMKIIKKPIYILCLLTYSIEEISDSECLRVADLISNSLTLKSVMHKHIIGYYISYEEIIVELYQRQQYPIYMTEKAFEDNRERIFSALKESGSKPKILIEKGYIIINPCNTENDRDKGYRY